MKYIITALILMAFTGCGSDDTEKKETTKEEIQTHEVVQETPSVIKETSPLNVEKEKTPPAIPQI